jgi:hypothetical protein
MVRALWIKSSWRISMPCFRPAAWLATMLTVLLVHAPLAADSEITLGGGFTRLTLEADLDFLDIDEITSLDGEGGLYGELRFSRSILIEPLRLGSGVQVAYFSTDGRSEPGLFAIEQERFLQIAPELQLSWRQRLGDLFIEPGVGGGLVAGNYRARGVTVLGVPQENVDEWEAGLGVRPFLRVGLLTNRFVFGVEGSYRWTNIEYEEVEGSLREWMAGAFISFRF